MNNQKTTSIVPAQAYRHCPKCAGAFEHKGGNCLKCIQCQYNFFINAAPAAGVFILDQNKRVLLAKRKFDPKKGTWQTPGGFMHPNEIPEDAIKREVAEELGVMIRVEDYIGSMPETYDYNGVILPFLAIYFTAIIIEGEITPNDDVAQAQYFSLKEIENLDITYPALLSLARRAIKKGTSLL